MRVGLLLLAPVVGVLALLPLYDARGPALAGIPFFYWYQLAWVPLTALCLLVAYRVTRPPR